MSILFRNKNELARQAEIVVSRLTMLVTDPALKNKADGRTLQEVFEQDYQHVYNYLQRALFVEDGEVKWALASRLDRAFFSVSRIDIGVCITTPAGEIEVASQVEAKFRAGYLLPTQLRAMEAGATV